MHQEELERTAALDQDAAFFLGEKLGVNVPCAPLTVEACRVLDVQAP